MSTSNLYSVIVCTYNRCQSLRRTLMALTAQVLKDRLSFEMVVIDNNSEDQTREIVHEMAASSPYPVRYVFEPEQGISFARNRGIKESNGYFLAFTDDDVMVDEYWLASIKNAFESKKIDGVGGKILPMWLTEPKTWFSKQLYPNLALIDYGDEPFELDLDRPLYGASMAFKKRVFDEVGLFRTDLGRRGKLLLGNEDTELCKRALSKGFRFIYDPKVCVRHVIDIDRMNKSYFRSYHFRTGETMVLSERDKGKGYRMIAGIPVWRFREYMEAFYRWILNSVLNKEAVTFVNELKIWEAFGYINGLRKKFKVERLWSKKES